MAIVILCLIWFATLLIFVAAWDRFCKMCDRKLQMKLVDAAHERVVIHDLERSLDGATFYVCVVVAHKCAVAPTGVHEHLRADGRWQYTAMKATLPTVDKVSAIARRNRVPITISPN